MTTPINDHVLELARILWDYHRLHTPLATADFVLALGSHDTRVAEYAASLVLNKYAPRLVTSGGYGKVTKSMNGKPEGELFADIVHACGVPRDVIIVESKATNTGENIVNTRDILSRLSIHPTSGILVTKPYMCRRAYATASKQWPELNWMVTSQDITFDAYCNKDVPTLRMIELMVGDLQRIQLYAEKGFQIPQDIPPAVWDAYLELVTLGFRKYIITPATSN